MLAVLVAMGAMSVASIPLRASETDNRIESSANQSYVFINCLNNSLVKIVSKDGVVTLTGTVASSKCKTMVLYTVARLPGVTRVDNQLLVSDEHPGEHSDTWIKTKVLAALLSHRDVSATAASVKVKDGVVILTGEAKSQAKKDLTTGYAREVDHVKAVVNNMTLATTKAPTSSFAWGIAPAKLPSMAFEQRSGRAQR